MSVPAPQAAGSDVDDEPEDESRVCGWTTRRSPHRSSEGPADQVGLWVPLRRYPAAPR